MPKLHTDAIEQLKTHLKVSEEDIETVLNEINTLANKSGLYTPLGEAITSYETMQESINSRLFFIILINALMP